jgi:hypothetical protein
MYVVNFKAEIVADDMDECSHTFLKYLAECVDNQDLQDFELRDIINGSFNHNNLRKIYNRSKDND